MNPSVTQAYGGHSRPIGHWCPRNPIRQDLVENQWNTMLDCEAGLWRAVAMRGGIKPYRYDVPPWLEIPEDGKRLNKIGSIVLPAANDTDTQVLAFQVDQGFDGCVTSVVNNYVGGTGGALVPGDGQLTWRIQRDCTWVRDFGAISSEMGSMINNPWANDAGVFFLQSGQLVQYFVNHASAPPPTIIGGRIICSIFGWLWPR